MAKEFKIGEKVWYLDVTEACFGFGEFSAYLKEGYVKDNTGSNDRYGVSDTLAQPYPWGICEGKYIFPYTDKGKTLAGRKLKELLEDK